MKKKLQKKPTQPVLALKLRFTSGCLMIHLSIRAPWLAALLIALAAWSMGAGTLGQLVDMLVRVVK